MLNELPPNMRAEFKITQCPYFSKVNLCKMQFPSIIEFEQEHAAQAQAIRQKVLRERKRNRNQHVEEPAMKVVEEPTAGNQEEDIGLAADEPEWANAGQFSYQAFDEVALTCLYLMSMK